MLDTKPALIWVDIETTGLDPLAHNAQILELGLRLTDDRLTTLREASWVVHFDREDLSKLSDFILAMHTKNGLLFECMQSERSMRDVEAEADRWLMMALPILPRGEEPPMAGSTVSFDRHWLKTFMPLVDARAHYRSLDVSTIKLACRLWTLDTPTFKDRETHRVLPDIQDSVTELRYYISEGIVKGWPYSLKNQKRDRIDIDMTVSTLDTKPSRTRAK